MYASCAVLYFLGNGFLNFASDKIQVQESSALTLFTKFVEFLQ